MIKNKRYIQFSGFGGCNGNVNRPWAFYEVSENGGLAKLYEEETSGGGISELSPNQDKLAIISGSHAGFCYNGYIIKVYDLKNRQLEQIDNKIDKSEKYTLYVQFEPKWLDNNTIKFKERKVIEKDCQNNIEDLTKFDEIKTIKID